MIYHIGTFGNRIAENLPWETWSGVKLRALARPPGSRSISSGGSEMAEVTIRRATVEDLSAINTIFNYYVQHSTCTFQIEAETAEARLAWFAARTPEQPVIVAERDGEVVGWASLSPHRSRGGYRQTAALSVYLRPEDQGQGIGKVLVRKLQDLAGEAGYHTLLGGVCTEQTASMRLHRSLGFVQVAHFREVGFKFGRWLDVAYFQWMVPATNAGVEVRRSERQGFAP
jgi:L-amino acid N-acyltransferase